MRVRTDVERWCRKGLPMWLSLEAEICHTNSPVYPRCTGRAQISTCEVSLRRVLISLWILCFALEGHLQVRPLRVYSGRGGIAGDVMDCVEKKDHGELLK